MRDDSSERWEPDRSGCGSLGRCRVPRHASGVESHGGGRSQVVWPGEKASKGLMDGFTLVGRYCRITEFSGFGIYLAWYLGSPCVAPCILVDVETHRLHMSLTVMPCSLARPLICALGCSLGYTSWPFPLVSFLGCAVVDRRACYMQFDGLGACIRRGGPCGITA